MKYCALLFSGGLDSVAMSILLRRERIEIVPIFLSHRHGGNVTKKEVIAAGQLALELAGRELKILKKRPASPGADAWYTEWGEVYYVRGLPISKKNKPRRNRIFLNVLKAQGLNECDFIALGAFGPSTNANVPPGDVCYEKLVKANRWLEPGQLVTFESLGITNKVDMLKAVGRRSKKACDAIGRSESCLMYFNTHCGECLACHERVDAFMEAWGRDQTRYRKGTYAHRRKGRRRAAKR